MKPLRNCILNTNFHSSVYRVESVIAIVSASERSCIAFRIDEGPMIKVVPVSAIIEQPPEQYFPLPTDKLRMNLKNYKKCK